MKTFEENLKLIATAEKTVLLRLYNQRDELVSIIPNIPGRQGSVRIFRHIADKNGIIDFEAAKEGLKIFEEKVEDVRNNPGKHQKLELLLGLKNRENLRIETVESSCENLLINLSGQVASAEECNVFIELLNQGKIRAAEKVKNIWEPQPYVIDGVLNYFGTHTSERMEGKYWDKIPLKTASYTDEEFEQGGVRYAPGCMVRTGAYIGPKTVVMNLAFVNIGAYIAGEGCMIDGGARVASCAQIGKNVKYGAGSGIEGILEPAGRLASIVEDNVKIGAMCEVTGIIGEGAVIASGVIMASGKKIYDEDTNDFVPPLECVVGEKTFLLPVIPPYRLAVGGSIPSKKGNHNTDAVILKAGDLRDSATMRHFEKQGILYV
ncbi:MAG: 2,3,4,5-tetrahydropyridine-2,6-dicarboxylate N-succinyltransferase [Deltaproteobacteria bacterium]|jgi:2,3,4,5-tetrahydropyridine-2-carboxylate N-succinyltransferase|nr:2,3,4,5-tetrahydropyridine-2,6-dicarboxylate N-succinyltransferase [Deltaproteobacteria bacterium]